MEKHIWLLLSLILALWISGPAQAQNQVDHSPYALLLKHHVVGSRVNYDGFKKDEALLDQYLAHLGTVKPATLSRNEAMAFYINAYNAFTIKLILSKYPDLNSIKELGSFFSSPWDKKFISLGGHKISLDHIEHEILRPQYKDPRIHFAVNCASKGCPPLRNTPYTGRDLNRQLDEQTTAFINNPKRNFFREGTLFLSKIFRWFREDFNDNPAAFVRQYARGDLKRTLDRAAQGGAKIKLSYLSYDWSLNR